MPNLRLKIHEVAERAKVSPSTVSRVLSGHPHVRAETRDLVLAAVRELGFTLPGQVNGEPGRSIAVVWRSGADLPGGWLDSSDLLRGVVAGVEEVCQRRGVGFRIERNPLTEAAAISFEPPAGVDGLILVGGMVAPRFAARLEELGVRYVVAAAPLATPVNCVTPDYLSGARAAADHLLGHGHSVVAFVNGPSSTETSAEKLDGCRLAFAARGLVPDPALIVQAVDFDHECGYATTRDLLCRTSRPTAIFYASDDLALGGLRAIAEAGLRVPQDLSVVGFYDYRFAAYTAPPLTSIRCDWRFVGRVAAMRLLQMAADGCRDRLKVTVPTELIVRASTGPANGR